MTSFGDLELNSVLRDIDVLFVEFYMRSCSDVPKSLRIWERRCEKPSVVSRHTFRQVPLVALPGSLIAQSWHLHRVVATAESTNNIYVNPKLAFRWCAPRPYLRRPEKQPEAEVAELFPQLCTQKTKSITVAFNPQEPKRVSLIVTPLREMDQTM